MRFNRFFLLSLLSLCSFSLSAQLISSEYGQNRIQYETYKWQRYESPNFAFSFTEDNEDLMEFLVPIAESSYQQLKSLLEYQVRQKIELIVYTDFSDFAQSNVGLEAPTINAGGVTKLLDNKMLIYFDGSHQNLEKLVREGIARVLLNRMLFGSNLQEAVQNSVLMHLPEWFTEGVIAYSVEEWNTEVDNELREAIFMRKFDNFLDLAEQEPRLAGHSLFHYIAQNHGKASVSNLLYLTRINRSVESGFLYVFGTSFYTIAGNNWFNYFSTRYNQDNELRLFPNAGDLTVSKNKNTEIKSLVISPNGKYVAYVEHNRGKQRIVLTDVAENTRKTLWEGGYKDHSKDIDKNYPMLAWRPTSQQLVVIHEKEDKPIIGYLSLDQEVKKLKSKPIKGLERVTSVSVLSSSQLILTGFESGSSNIYRYQSGTVSSLTNDIWDDLHATVATLNGQQGVIFASNRPAPQRRVNSKELPLANLDLFFMPLGAKGGELIQLTNTPLASEGFPLALKNNQYAYLSDKNGIVNRYIGQVDSVVQYYLQKVIYKDGNSSTLPKDSLISKDAENVDSTYLIPVYKYVGNNYANTNYSRNIIEHHLSDGGKMADLLYRDDEYQLFVRDLKTDRKMEPAKTNFRTIVERLNGWKASEKSSPIEKKEKIKPKEKERKNAPTDKTIEEELKELEEEMKTDSSAIEARDTIPPGSDTTKVDIDNYLFQSEFKDVEDPDKDKDTADKEVPRAEEPIILIEGNDGEITKKDRPKPKQLSKDDTKLVQYNAADKRKYKSMFKVDEITFRIDNTPMFWGMEQYLGGNYKFVPLSLMFTTGFTDVLEDYRFEIGVRMPVNFNGMEYFITFEDLKHRLDKKYSLYRRGRVDDYNLVDTNSTIVAQSRGRTIKHLAMAEFRYPLTKFTSLRSTVSFQADKVAIIAEDLNTLSVPVFNETRMGLRLEYVFDNTVDLRLNAKKGHRSRFYMDLFQPVGARRDSIFRFSLSSPTAVLGWDSRQYFSPDNKTVFAFRFTGGASFGQQKILYSLGGMENRIYADIDDTFVDDIPLPDGDDFAYQIPITNLRGFKSNIRNGSNYALINAEMRIPITEYLSRTPPQNVLLRNLQIIGFYDVGTAWQGLSPFANDNPLNTTLIDPGAGGTVVSPVRVRVNYYRRPIIQGFGLGVRTVVLGYYLRLDYAWGLETGEIGDPLIHLSLGTDF